MDARDYQNRLNKSSDPNKPSKVSIWDRIANLSLETPGDRVKFLITFLIIGFILIVFGDILSHLTFKASGLASIIIGWLVIAAGFIAPIFQFLEGK
jgi:hypothetical protein